MNITNEQLKQIIKEETQAVLFKPGLLEHVQTKTPLHENIFRVGSSCYFNTIRQGRHFYKMGLYEAVNEEERHMLENTDLGEWAMFEGEEVPLDFPMYEETLEEAKKFKDMPVWMTWGETEWRLTDVNRKLKDLLLEAGVDVKWTEVKRVGHSYLSEYQNDLMDWFLTKKK